MSDSNPINFKSIDYLTEGKLVIQVEQNALSRLAEKLDLNFSKACEILLKTKQLKGRIIVIGIGKSGHIGHKIAATFASTGTPAFFVHPAEAVHGDLGMISKEDTVLFISSSGSTPELVTLIDPLMSIGCQIIAMTGKPNSPIAKASRVHLDASVDQEACPLGLAPTASTTAALVLGDALAIAILKARGFTAEQFGLIHPGGTLGRRLSVKIADLMHTGDEIPKVLISATFSEALEQINQKSLGLVLIIDTEGRLAGIMTDGDIRRKLSTHALDFNTPVQELMSKNPKTLGPGDQAIQAINLMETYKITALAIVNENKILEGVVHMHRLLSSGLI